MEEGFRGIRAVNSSATWVLQFTVLIGKVVLFYFERKNNCAGLSPINAHTSTNSNVSVSRFKNELGLSPSKLGQQRWRDSRSGQRLKRE